MLEQPTIIKGGVFTDHRGTMRFVNDFHFEKVKRFYMIKHADISVVRAWQYHRFERKYFYPVRGRFVVAWVKIDDGRKPSVNLNPEYHILSAEKSEILFVPGGYANGLKALEPDSEIMVLSDKRMDEAVKENIRFPAEWWLNWDGIKHR